ncbi:MAG TPA: ComEC/Rec2 family competence protein [Patescibacteria group bacterium]
MQVLPLLTEKNQNPISKYDPSQANKAVVSPGYKAFSLEEYVAQFSSHNLPSDTPDFGQKRLIDVRSVQECGKSLSVKCGFSIGMKYLFSIKSLLLKTLIGLVPVSTFSLIVSILFGDTSYLTPPQRLLFETTGTQHLLAASGYNVGMVSSGALVFVRRWSRRGRLMALMLAIWIYTLYAMAGASIVRAAIMHSQSLIAEYLHLPYSPRWSLLVTVYIMLILNPAYLTDIGFQLSVAATASILIGLHHTPTTTSPWRKWVTAEGTLLSSSIAPRASWLQTIKEYWLDSLRVSIWAMVGTLPLVLYHFGESSLWSVVATGLVAWLLPPIMVAGVALAALGFFLDVRLLGYLVHALVTFFVSLLGLFRYLPQVNVSFQLTLSQVAGWWISAYAWQKWQGRRG